MDPFAHLHSLLLSGNAAAPERLVAECGRPLERVLHRRHFALPRDMVRDAANDAFLALITDPAAYDPARGGLLNYLIHIADHKVVDRLRARQRLFVREVPMGTMADLERAENQEEIAGAYNRDVQREEASDLPPELARWVDETLPDPLDRSILALICEGRQTVTEFASVLAVTHLPIEEQRTYVKRHRDRVLRRLRYRREELRSLYYG